jgi:hypothetical protein
VIVAGQVSQAEHNAIWHLFSAERVRRGAMYYQMRSSDATSFLGNLFERYKVEGFEMPYTVEDFRRDYVKEHLEKLSPEERLKGLSPEERLKGLPAEERLKGLSAEELAKVKPQIDKLLQQRSQASQGGRKEDLSN